MLIKQYNITKSLHPNKEKLDKICPMWVHFKLPRDYSSKGAGFLSGKIDVSRLDVKNGMTLASVKKIKQINQLRTAINMLPNNSEIRVNIRADKDTPIGNITKIKQVLRECYIYYLNMEKKE